MAVVLETSLGDITIDLYTQERPRCCLNFLKLCKIKYYNFSLFHSVQRNLVAQTGDPTGTGRGGESIFSKLYGEQAKFFEMEIKPRIKHKKMGTVSMVDNGESMHGSQFFITLAENIDYLDSRHTVFGEVAEGFDVLKKFNEVYVDKNNVPFQDVRIYHTVILEDPYDDPAELGSFIPDRSPEPSKEQLDSGRIRADEEIDDAKGKTIEEVNEMLEVKEAKANAQLLEMVGDLPDVEMAPPENVLFVCKLNPVTTDEDLEIIFSRFGTIKSCEVIKDHKTGESLQYAFIEFEKREYCENAYFKMDNVLIDDRRIHVDFSQSVSKVKWNGKGKGVWHPKEDKGERPSYVIKDTAKKHDYSFVFDEEDKKQSKSHKKKKKKHSKKFSSSDSEEDEKQTKRRKANRDKDDGPWSSNHGPRGHDKSSQHEHDDRNRRDLLKSSSPERWGHREGRKESKDRKEDRHTERGQDRHYDKHSNRYDHQRSNRDSEHRKRDVDKHRRKDKYRRDRSRS